MVKSPAEIALIRRSVETNSRAFEQAVSRVRPGMKEQDLAAELEYRMRRLGAEKPSFETIVAGGARSALPHAQPTAARLAAGQLVVVDMGALQDGYCSDMTRMLFLGTPRRKVKRTYRRRAGSATGGASTPCVPERSTAARGRRRAQRAEGLRTGPRRSCIPRATGWAWRSTSRRASARSDKTQARRPGMAITIEPGVYIEGFGGIRIEDTVVVTETGCEILTPTPKELRII